MTDLILIYMTCDNVSQAQEIGKKLMEKRLCACINIIPNIKPMFFWPPKSGIIDESDEVAMIVKTIKSKYSALEEEIYKIHPHETPCIIAIPTEHVGEKYYNWLVDELK